MGANLSDVNNFLRGIDPRWVGYDFDPRHAAEMRPVLPERRAPRSPSLCRDSRLSRSAISPGPRMGRPSPCPLGQGVVDWRPFFTALARARFTGPITIQVAYPSTNELNAFRHDLEFVRKQIATAYAAG